MSASPTIVRRQVKIDFDPVPAGPWFTAGGPLETMFNAASVSFPPTEKFFIAAVRDYQDRISDPILSEQVRGFIFQEAMHNKVHIDCNAMLARHNPSCRRAEAVTRRTFQVLSRLPRWFRLSLSSALEHFTSMAADTLLHYPDEFSQIVPTEVAQMWLWHAAEETEHKAVCFDVHRAVVGSGPLSYLNRIAGMLLATPLFLFVLLLMTATVMSWGRRRPSSKGVAPAAVEEAVEAAGPGVSDANRQDPKSTSASDASRFLGRSMLGLLRELVPWRLYFSYYRPSFHPWDHDNSHFISEWQKRYPSFGLITESAMR
jgi:predicted metal-dependent hydrolase